MKFTLYLILILIVTSCAIPEQKIETTKNNIVEEKEISNTNNSDYNWDKHNDFKIFYADFKKAIENNDRDAIYAMMEIPFLNGEILEGERYVIKNRAEFDKQFDNIFNKERINAIKLEKFIDVEEILKSDDEMEKTLYKKNEMVLSHEFTLLSFFPNKEGKYKLKEIPYRP